MLRLLSLLIVMATPVCANIGEITSVNGSGAIERGEDAIEAEKGTGIDMLDTAVTANANMRINFIDDTVVDITQHSRLLIDDFVYDPASGKGSLGLKATLGTVRYASGQIAKRNRQNVRIRTPSATIGVRGTDETDAGFVLLNQAFQATIASNSMSPPTKPLLLDLDESMINSLLLLRKVKPYEEEVAKILKKKMKNADFLGLDFLQFDGLDYDALTEELEGIWLTALDNTDSLLQDMLIDMLDQLNSALMQLFLDELATQNSSMLRREQNVYGFDPTTGITLMNQSPNWVFSRRDDNGNNFVELTLNQGYGYTIDLKQGGWELYDYRLGDNTGNSINITQ